MAGDRQQPTRRRPWPRITWWYSLILPVALLLILVTIILNAFGDDPAVRGTVRDAYTGEPVAGARVSAAGTAVMTDDGGGFSFDTSVAGTISVDRDSYESTAVQLQPTDEKLDLDIVIRPTTLTGVVTNARTGEPVAGAVVSVVGDSSTSATTVTDTDGRYLLVDVPRDATVSVSYAGFAQDSQPVDNRVQLDFEIRPDTITGLVTDSDGRPLRNATVQLGDASAVTEEDGSYVLGGIPDSGQIVIKKAGYHEVVGDYPEGLTFDVELEPFDVKAIYVSGDEAADDDRWSELLDLVESTELNAVVLDVKDDSGFVRYASNAPLVEAAGAITNPFDLEGRLADLHERDIYAIARVVVFEDPVLARARPELAIQDQSTGDVWTTWDGRAWVNAIEQGVWDYNIAIAQEVAEAGFDEIQFDGLRFPTDGPLENADYGTDVNAAIRVQAVTGFLAEAREVLGPSRVYVAANVSGISVWDESDVGIGQDLDDIAPLVDVISPTVYPSHFRPGQFGFDLPNDHPYEVVLWVLERSAERLGPDADKMRPWLQDFSYGLGIAYGPAEVQAQIAATQDFGSPGWMLWNVEGTYTVEALDPAS